jgi:hypothetical protein
MRAWLLWTASFMSLPIGGYLALLLIGPVDGAGPALLAGLLTGAVIGTGQSLLSSRRLDPRRWIPATTIGMGLGLPLGAALVDHHTGLADLVLMGLVNGLVLGAAQALVLRKWQWAAAMPLLWALGWAITTVAGIDVDERFSVFGSSGAVVFAALSGLLLHILVPVARRKVALA